jgi:hypothetical protein
MIKGIYSGGKYVQVNNGQTPSVSIYNSGNSFSNGAQGFAGQLRYNTNNQSMEVFDGNMWQIISTSVAQVGLSPIAEEALDWVRQKMQEEKDLFERMKRHPGLKDSYDQFKVMDALTAEEEKSKSGVYQRA